MRTPLQAQGICVYVDRDCSLLIMIFHLSFYPFMPVHPQPGLLVMNFYPGIILSGPCIVYLPYGKLQGTRWPLCCTTK